VGIGRKLDCEALAGVIGINQRHLPSLYISNASLYCLRSLSSRIAKVMNEFCGPEFRSFSCIVPDTSQIKYSSIICPPVFAFFYIYIWSGPGSRTSNITPRPVLVHSIRCLNPLSPPPPAVSSLASPTLHLSWPSPHRPVISARPPRPKPRRLGSLLLQRPLMTPQVFHIRPRSPTHLTLPRLRMVGLARARVYRSIWRGVRDRGGRRSRTAREEC